MRAAVIVGMIGICVIGNGARPIAGTGLDGSVEGNVAPGPSDLAPRLRVRNAYSDHDHHGYRMLVIRSGHRAYVGALQRRPLSLTAVPLRLCACVGEGLYVFWGSQQTLEG